MFGEIRNEHGERLDYTFHEGKGEQNCSDRTRRYRQQRQTCPRRFGRRARRGRYLCPALLLLRQR